jgi:hypothetical protein
LKEKLLLAEVLMKDKKILRKGSRSFGFFDVSRNLGQFPARGLDKDSLDSHTALDATYGKPAIL